LAKRRSNTVPARCLGTAAAWTCSVTFSGTRLARRQSTAFSSTETLSGSAAPAAKADRTAARPAMTYRFIGPKNALPAVECKARGRRFGGFHPLKGRKSVFKGADPGPWTLAVQGVFLCKKFNAPLKRVHLNIGHWP